MNNPAAMTSIIAIDPGASGGIATCRAGRYDCCPLPDTQGDLVDYLREIRFADDIEHADSIVILEQVGGFAGVGRPGSAMFKFGEGYGFLKGVIQALKFKLVMVRPQTWQKVFGLGTASHCASKTIWKNKLLAEAQRRFPGLKITLATADALLLLEYWMLEHPKPTLSFPPS